MVDYDDAINDGPLYAAWLCRTWQAPHLATRVECLLRDGGYTVPEGLTDSLSRYGNEPVLAGFIAANLEPKDDPGWEAYCRHAYPKARDASDTVAELNGGRASWRMGP